ncbi:MAG: type II toxin-antitoxin system prevent-host-death family antitoxin [Mariprofundaceae bacterium]|nr:type II toxin-antitoxin system prevent-host-death family antitoxin [Mariprofundaceae bacterium]
MQVNAKEFRQHLSEYLDRASRGQSLDISMRGKPMARLTRIELEPKPESDDLFGIWLDADEMDASVHVHEMRQGRQF